MRRRAAMALVALLLAGNACGYTLVGRGAFLPEYITVVAIPTFTNNTSRYELEVRVTDAVTRELVARGDFRVVGDATNADAVLRGQIDMFEVRPVGLDRAQNADQWQVTVRAAVTFTDLVANEVIFTSGSFIFQDQFEFPATSQGTVDIEVGSIDEISQEFARTLVSSILEGF